VTSHAYPVPIPEEARGVAQWLGAAPWAEMIWALAIVAFFQLVLSRTRWGLHTVATGRQPARRPRGRRQGQPDQDRQLHDHQHARRADRNPGGLPHQLDRAAGRRLGHHVLGRGRCGHRRTALAGGSGTIVGALLAPVVLGILRDGFNLLGINADRYDLILGGAILGAMVLNVYLSRLRVRGSLR
jgi:simple sugar transport system permease protein